MHFVTMAMLMHYIDGKGHISELRSKRNDLTNPICTVRIVNHATSYLWPWGWTHNIHTHSCIPRENVFKKPDIHRLS